MGKIAKMFTFPTDGCNGVDDMLRQSNTDWDVISEPARVQSSIGQAHDGGFRALIRPDTGTALAFVGDRYRVNSHRDQLAPLDGLIRAGTLVPSTCSVWDNGALIAYQIRCPDLDVVIKDRDVVSPLLTLVFAYGFPLADTAFFADFRWFCKNQMGTVRNLIDERVNHRGQNKLIYADLVTKRLGELGGELAGHYQTMRRLTEKPLAGRALYEYFGESLGCDRAQIDAAYVTPVEELHGPAAKIPEVLECYAVDDAGAAGTVWQAYNAVTRYETHGTGKPTRGRNSTPETRTRRMLLGEGSTIAANAFSVAERLTA